MFRCPSEIPTSRRSLIRWRVCGILSLTSELQIEHVSKPGNLQRERHEMMRVVLENSVMYDGRCKLQRCPFSACAICLDVSRVAMLRPPAGTLPNGDGPTEVAKHSISIFTLSPESSTQLESGRCIMHQIRLSTRPKHRFHPPMAILRLQLPVAVSARTERSPFILIDAVIAGRCETIL